MAETSIAELIDTMSQVWRLMRKQIFQSSDQTTFLQRHSIRYIAVNPDSTQKQLAQHFGMSASAAAQFVDRLEKLGYLAKTQDKKDKRITRLSLSLKGQNEWKRMQDEKKKRLQHLLHNMPAEDIRELLRIQKKILETLQKEQ